MDQRIVASSTAELDALMRGLRGGYIGAGSGGEPIRNPVTNEEHRMRTVLPNGWVFHEAESAAGFAKGIGAIKFDLNRRHSSLANVAWDPNGLVHSYDEYKQKFGRP